MKYGQKIRVTSGFYEGMEGVAKREKSIIKDGMIDGTIIKVKLQEFDIGYFYIDFPESSLELIQ